MKEGDGGRAWKGIVGGGLGDGGESGGEERWKKRDRATPASCRSWSESLVGQGLFLCTSRKIGGGTLRVSE